MDVTITGARDNNYQENPIQIQRFQKLATGREFSSHAKWDVKFLIVANTSGLQCFVKQDTLQTAFVQAAILLQHPQPLCATTANQTIVRIRDTVTATSSLQGLYPPAGFAKAAEELNTQWTHMELPTGVTLQQALHTNIVKETKVLHCSQDIIYTDGSKREMNQFKLGTNLAQSQGLMCTDKLPLRH